MVSYASLLVKLYTNVKSSCMTIRRKAKNLLVWLLAVSFVERSDHCSTVSKNIKIVVIKNSNIAMFKNGKQLKHFFRCMRTFCFELPRTVNQSNNTLRDL